MNIMRREREDKKTNGIYKNGNRISVTKNIVEQKVILFLPLLLSNHMEDAGLLFLKAYSPSSQHLPFCESTTSTSQFSRTLEKQASFLFGSQMQSGFHVASNGFSEFHSVIQEPLLCPVILSSPVVNSSFHISLHLSKRSCGTLVMGQCVRPGSVR